MQSVLPCHNCSTNLTCSAAVNAAAVVVVVVAVVHVAAAAVEEHDTALLGSGAKVASSRQDGTTPASLPEPSEGDG